MKSIRKSLNSNKDSIRNQISTPLPLPTISKPISSSQPPQKVIKALQAHRPEAAQELSFGIGDFFHVTNDPPNSSHYEAHNPITGARGLVPKDKFEEFRKGRPASSATRISQPGSPNLSNLPPSPRSPPQKSHVFYAIVMHDFEAERADELDAKRGDAVTVVAQSNREWFVAKPIGKLGRPGLIPVAFVEIHDPLTGKPIHDVNALMDAGDLPRVEDWKRAMYNYKVNSIPLGVLDSPPPTMQDYPPPFSASDPSISVQAASPNLNGSSSPYSQPPPRQPTPDCLPEGILLSGQIVSFHYEMDQYWFRVDAIFQPYAPPGQTKLPPAKQLILFRVYNDFYDFQVALLDTFPREAGREGSHPRMLPYMPGPSDRVDHALTATRRLELDEYLHNLCDLKTAGAHYILEHRVVREFLALRPGDVDNALEPRLKEMEELFLTEFSAQDQYPSRPNVTSSAPPYDLDRSMNSLKMRDDDDGSEYEDGPPNGGGRQAYDRHPYSSQSANDSQLRLQAHVKSHQRTGSGSSVPYNSNSRSNSPAPRSNSPLATSSDRWNGNTNSVSSSSLRSNHSGRSRSQSTTNFNSPPISATNPQTAFVKIKIFDRLADDLIAIRVHPKVSHAELMDKVQTRLGGEVSNLRYRDSVTNGFVGLDNDQDLRLWMESTDKYVLYAD